MGRNKGPKTKGNGRGRRSGPNGAAHAPALAPPRAAPPSLDEFFAQIGDRTPYLDLHAASTGVDLGAALKFALGKISAVRNRAAVAYLGNVFAGGQSAAISAVDHLPFSEMLRGFGDEVQELDVLLVTPGGNAESVIHMKDETRRRFSSVEMVVPYKAMSAGTLWCCSGDRVWLDDQAVLGPIDPQVFVNNQFVPAQSIFLALERLQHQIDDCVNRGVPVPWTVAQAVANLNLAELGRAVGASRYVAALATDWLARHKFASWTQTEAEGNPVDEAMRRRRAEEIAGQLCSYELWNAHGHEINRDVLREALRLHIDEPAGEFQRWLRKFWALAHYMFQSGPLAKAFLASHAGPSLFLNRS